jgi:hypothetical protein
MAPKPEKPKEWYEELAFADPRERDAILAGMGYTRSGEFQGFGADEEEVPYTEEDYVSAYQGMPGNFGLEGVGAIPQYTAKGALDPRDLTQVGQGINVAQDYGALFVDNALNSLLGPGAYGPDAFTPTYEYGDIVVPKGRNRLEDLASRGGWEGYVADKILNQGMSTTEAMGALQDFVENAAPDDTASQKAVDFYNSVLRSMPRLQEKAPQTTRPGLNPETGKFEPGGTPVEDIGFWGDYDYDRIFNRTTELADSLYEDEVPGWQDPQTGQYYDRAPTEIKTPQMEWYDKYGLPYPTASYEDPEYAERLLNREEGTTPQQRAFEAQEYQRAYQDLVGKTREATQAFKEQPALFDEMRAAWEALQPQTQSGPGAVGLQAPATPATAGRPAVPSREITIPGVRVPGGAWGQTMTPGAMNPLRITTPGRPAEPGTPASEPQQGWLPGLFQQQAPARQPNMPMVRTLPNGQIGLVGREKQGLWGVLGDMIKGVPDPRFARGSERAISPFAGGWGKGRPVEENPKGKARPLQAKDVDYREREHRIKQAEDRKNTALRAQRLAERNSPLRNDLRTAAMLHFMATLNGRTPLGDVQADRMAGIRSLGL